MPADIFTTLHKRNSVLEINIPVGSLICQYTGLNTTEMEQRVRTYSQYASSSSVNGISDIKAETVDGISLRKLYFVAA